MKWQELLACSLAALTGLAACGAPDDTQVTVSPPTVTMTAPAVTVTADAATPTPPTVTVTETATPDATTTPPAPPQFTVPEVPSGTETPTTPSEPPQGVENPIEESDLFDEAYAVDTATRVVEDLETVDERLLDGIAVASALYLLSDSYGYLGNAGVPPGVDAAEYVTQLDTLQTFAELAGDEYADDPVNASARYAVLKEETVIIFNQINAATGSNLQVP